jgi:hypothetical protein
MKETERKKRNKTRLRECYPKFARLVEKVLSELEGQDIRPRIQEAWRSPVDQLEAYNRGNSKLKFGFHNVTAQNGSPEALAVDILDDDAPLNPSVCYLLKLAVAARKNGLQTGILWGLPKRLADSTDLSIRLGDFDTKVKVGWDPCHVEVTGLTLTDVKKGARPS